MEPRNKTLAVEIEDLKNKIIEKLQDEEISLWHNSDVADHGWNQMVDRAIEIVEGAK